MTNDSARRRIPPSGINLFQLIYVLIREFEEKTGQPALNLSLGNPDIVPVEAIRELRAQEQRGPRYELHTYAEDRNLDFFCESLSRAFTGLDYTRYPHLKAVPIPGIKTATALLPLACGLHLGDRRRFHVVTNLPAYDVMGTWTSSYLASNRVVWPLSPDDGMSLSVPRLEEALRHAGVERPDLVFVIRPGNPASRGASEGEWRALIEFCISRGSRLVNDGAYTTLAAPGAHTPLARVAVDYPDLEWAELYSLSKAFSDPGARLGAMVGSREFIEDFVLIKGNTESGPVPSMMTAYARLLADPPLARTIMDELFATYRARLDFLVPRLKAAGLRPACETDAGFFTLWRTPDEAFGIDLRDEAARRGIARAELYNRLVIERTGLVGVHFSGPQGSDEAYTRYAVCTDVLAPTFQPRFTRALEQIQPRYRD
ncbi:pyridoxal phosphate-dependent aminotransferase [Archangium lansingense]|uniref:Pyridoxal phosphate-dependent aminotransferase n=1 Tax=Archangium lansingense TaxID=2995310 RepID=A0ABT4ACP3_9BACT|nr:pyridoxal phosphate-dependent aminotransferase [Archangium lansinium]MCY1079443.1 pyridoxal phosphate-dependent aminotransferase [Archangium lansinium]